MQTQDTLTSLCEKYCLGKMQGEALPAEGGLLHRMYHVVTDQGAYAVKLLNPDIMKRPTALRNMTASERIAEAMAAHGRKQTAGFGASQPGDTIPAVSALKFQGQHVLVLKGDNASQYALVYPWLEARSLFAPDIGVTHCRRVGRILGLIHHADLQPKDIGELPEKEEGARPLYDWQGYLSLAGQQQASWRSDYEAMLPDLLRWDRAAVDAMKTVQSRQVISHRDLDPKNILWQGTAPLIIDWEAAGYVNPWQELLEVLNYWGRAESGGYDPSLCRAILQEYRQYMDPGEVDWTPVFACSYDGMLGWLEYTLKMALGLEGEDPAQGVNQLLATYRELRLYDAHAKTLREMITG